MNLSLRRSRPARTPAKHTPAGVRAVASAAELAQPAGAHAAPDEPAAPEVDYDTSYDHSGWDDTGRPEGQDLAGITAAWEGAQDAGQLALHPEDTLMMPVAALSDTRPAAAAAPPADEDGTLPRRTRQPGPRPQVLPLSPEGRAILGQVLDGLRNLPDGPGGSRLRSAMAAPQPSAWLRAIMPGRRSPWDALPGRPSFAGIIRDPDGLPYAGLYLGEPDGDGRMVIDVRDARWLYDLMAAASEALDALESAEITPEVTRSGIPAVPAAGGAR